MIQRLLRDQVQLALEEMPAVALLGARQVGKTTLARSLDPGAVYLDLESPEDQLKLRNPVAYLREHADHLVILDEIQRAPGLFEILRGVIDENRRNGYKVPGPELNLNGPPRSIPELCRFPGRRPW